MASLPFVLTIFAMGWELSRHVLRAARLARELEASERRLSLAASAGHVALWEWHVERDDIWLSSEGRALHGVPPGQAPSFPHFASTLHPDDRARVLGEIRRAVAAGGRFAVEYRTVLPGGGARWIAGSGAAERDPRSGETLLRGVSVDITARRRSEDELQALRGELAHLARVATLGELSGSLAHELNQPLASILSNAQAAQRLLAQEPPDLAEMLDILADIVSEDRRAGDVIRRLRTLLKRGEPERRPLALSEVIGEALALMRSDLVARGVAVSRDLAEPLPPVSGDRVPLQQVLLNLVTNACDAMAANVPGERRLTVTARRAGPSVRVSVRDEGHGLPPDPARIF
ncbi:MAG TPA: histidine kinase dimerization/phospho-acceptor domain-containing protein, partial [Verrucomicrobiota bacterium]|nr:histidine kinase dimerization/phospho-acceptor domain-containing protein [Verrucomicrobiota bacterium]